MNTLTPDKILNVIYKADDDDILDLWNLYCNDNQLKHKYVYKMVSSEILEKDFQLCNVMESINTFGFNTHDNYFIKQGLFLVSFNDLREFTSPISFFKLADWIIKRYKLNFLAHYKHLLKNEQQEEETKMSILKPQNEHQEGIIQAVLGVLQNVPIQMKPKGSHFYDNVVNTAPFNFLNRYDWRVKPQGLNISIDIWKLLDKKWRYIAMDKNQVVWVYTDKPEIIFYDDIKWTRHKGDILIYPVQVNTQYIDWKDSLTERPQELS